MNLTGIKTQYNLENNFLYKDVILSKFANVFLSSKQASIYKLYHKYVFRSDVVEKHITETYPWHFKNSKFSWDNPDIQEQINDWSYYFIGYTRFSTTEEYCELFLSIKDFDAIDKTYHCTGFSVNTHDSKYNYSFENMIDFGYTEFKYPILIDNDLGLHIKKFYESIN